MILNADAREIPLRDGSVHCVVTSPPYWGLRDYGMAGQFGLERTPEEYVAALVAVFREVWRVLRDDGTCWLNLGDSYSNAGTRQGDRDGSVTNGVNEHRKFYAPTAPGLKNKDLVGIPWRVAFALQADGWYLRSDVIWSKPNPMPESVTDRPTKAHEYVFLLAKRERYYYDAEAIKEPATHAGETRVTTAQGFARQAAGIGIEPTGNARVGSVVEIASHRNRRTVWEIATQPYPEAHFATFPEALVEPCILAGTSERGACSACGAPWGRVVERTPATVKAPGSEYGNGAGRNDGGRSMLVGASSLTTGWQPACTCAAPLTHPIVLDPFAGSGTVGLVCQRLGRRFVGLELKPEYCAMAQKRTAQMGLV